MRASYDSDFNLELTSLSTVLENVNQLRKKLKKIVFSQIKSNVT